MRAIASVMVVTLLGGSIGCSDDEPAASKVPGEAELNLFDDVAPLEEPTYENVAKLLRGDPAVDDDRGMCAYSGCHSGPGKGGLTFRAAVLDETMVYRSLVESSTGPAQACEYHPLRRVEPGDPSKSWLYIKLVGETVGDNELDLEPADDWDDTMSACRSDFPGSLMPFADGEPVVPLEPNELRMIAEWILDGAPGPVTQ